jgi:hypothetical protein
MFNIILIIFAVIVTIILLFGLYFYFKYFFPIRPKEIGFEYVYVELDGSVRELNEDEVEYLTTDFIPSDGNRPYIKYRYKELTPDGKIYGFIKRNRVPKRIEIRKI